MRKLMAAHLLPLALLACHGTGTPEAGPDAGTPGKTDDPGETADAGHGGSDAADVLLAASGEAPAHLQVIRLGAPVTHVDVAHESDAYAVALTAHAGRFHALFMDGTLLTIDGNTAEVLSVATIPAAAPHALEVGDGIAWITEAERPEVLEVDLQTGELLARHDVSVPGDAIQGGRHMLLLGERLHVVVNLGERFEPAGGYLVVLDTATGEVLARKELTWEHDGQTHPPVNFELPIVHQRARDRLIIAAKGRRPVDTGVDIKVRLDYLVIETDLTDLSPTFNGHRVLSEELGRMVRLEHTSTPVSSTHVQLSRITAEGDFEDEEGGPILDLFEETDELRLNPAGTLAVLPNACGVGFCTTGRGLNLIDVEAGALLPKITSEALGFAPRLATFLRE